ncbi:Lrp/AsnC family transcriptional regulator [Kaustia mangrovi]|uniref:Lrp/AsnC family transcriptional regulator n=1 Tax=Kaustia mangrovi TaxID=2593653 RepID=A0A7S8C670_9HYPH|nr:Lrp/AsnC family transcriptional regulator [Kaustia mangrovi]QPC43939.1 Lrp/AsnC family transcriptional regulator [Kaustia mangrovi]
MPKPDLDQKDLAILAALQRDGRLTNVELAETVALSPSPCLRRVKRLERMGVIRGYRAVLDRRAVGLGLTVFVDIRVEKHSFENAAALHETLLAMPEVVSCHMISGEADFLAEVVVPDLDAYEELLTGKLLRLPMVKDIRSNFAMRPVRTDGPLPVAQAVPSSRA